MVKALAPGVVFEHVFAECVAAVQEVDRWLQSFHRSDQIPPPCGIQDFDVVGSSMSANSPNSIGGRMPDS